MSNKDRGGLSKREWEKKYGKKWEGGSSGGSSGGSIIDQILGVTPKEKDPFMPFDEYYTDEDRKIDEESAIAMFQPKLTQDIDDLMQDLDTWNTNEVTNYKRLLRRGRSMMASGGGAIGLGEQGERQQAEEENRVDHQAKVDAQGRAVEKQVGSEAFAKGGYNSYFNGGREGNLIQEFNTNVEEQKLWDEQQRQLQYGADSNAYYSSPSNNNFR
jgi:hypothetical protein